jgi:hypothetical protein
MADNMSIDKNDPVRDESGDESGTSSSRDAEAQANSTNTANSTQENQQPKRKGGRKPVRCLASRPYLDTRYERCPGLTAAVTHGRTFANSACRSMLPQRSGSSATARRKQLFARGGRSTSNN